MSTKLIYRKSKTSFNSIENVFNTLMPYLNSKKIELPYHNQGLANRIKNILFIKRNNFKSAIHITGHDHYAVFGCEKNKSILTIHDIEFVKRNKGLKRFLLKKLWIDWPMKRATIITTISEFSKKEILSLNTYNTPIKVIYNPLTLPLKHAPKVFNKDCPTILNIGVKQNKNIGRLTEALNGINCELIIIGKPSEPILNKLKENKINFTFKYGLTNDELIKEYENCDILSFISTYEGFGLPIIEAQAIGRPVITSNTASMPEVAGEDALLVDPYSVEEIKKGINDLIYNPELREKLIQKGLKNVKRFEPEKIAKQYSKLYQIINEQ